MARVLKLSQIAPRGPDDEPEDWTENQRGLQCSLPQAACIIENLHKGDYETENEYPENCQTDPRQCRGIPIQNIPPKPSLVR
jgi:hypothetical protein